MRMGKKRENIGREIERKETARERETPNSPSMSSCLRVQIKEH